MRKHIFFLIYIHSDILCTVHSNRLPQERSQAMKIFIVQMEGGDGGSGGIPVVVWTDLDWYNI